MRGRAMVMRPLCMWVLLGYCSSGRWCTILHGVTRMHRDLPTPNISWYCLSLYTILTNALPWNDSFDRRGGIGSCEVPPPCSMRIRLLCPYIDPAYSEVLDMRLGALPRRQRIEKLQQLVYHLQRNPNIPSLCSGDVFFECDDVDLDKFIHTSTDALHQTNIKAYESLVASMFANSHGNTITCQHCGIGEVEWSIKQTRSADEGSTVFCACKNCKTRWKM
jgi:DNA-directed RNA polymerase subunit M/transcription elongation factor TFIIS